MRKITLEHTDIFTSKVGFGTASLHHILSSKTRKNLINSAINSGITHFDTAVLYGNGIAEKELGKVLDSYNREDLTISTKVGFHLNSFQRSFPYTSIIGRKIAGSFLKNNQISHSVNFTKKISEINFHQSLKNLCTDYVDILFIHEPYLDNNKALIDLIPWLEKQKSLGKVRYLGLAGENLNRSSLFQHAPGIFSVLQTHINNYSFYKNVSKPQIYYGIYSDKNLIQNNHDYHKVLNSQNQMILYSSRKQERVFEFCQNFQ